jgi:rhodanese-related sulfurtransferase
MVSGTRANLSRGGRPPLARGRRDHVTVEELLAAAQAQIPRLTPAQAVAAQRQGAILIDIRPAEQRDRDGLVPGSEVISRNVLEWRLDPRCEYRDPAVARFDRQLVLICDEGYQSSLAAVTLRLFGLDVADVIGGVQAWRRAGLELRRPGLGRVAAG